MLVVPNVKLEIATTGGMFDLAPRMPPGMSL